jgi:predicted dehydrogenase
MIRVGLIGAAGIAPQALLAPARRRDDLEVVAIAARSAESAERFATEHGIPVAVEGYAALLERDDIDLVYIALPPSEHARWSIAALESGKDVLCEKPITMNAAEAEAVAAAADRTGRLVVEAFHDHYHPLTGVIRDVVGSGALGELVSIDTSFTADNPFSPTSLRHVPELGGGALMDLGCYPVHWIRAISGEEPTVVGARASAGPLGADETVDADFTLPSGALARLHASMAPGSPFAAPFLATGTRGSVRVDNLVLPHLGHSLVVERDGVSFTTTVGGRETYDHELDAVLDSIRTREPAATGPLDFVATMRVIDAVYAAAGMPRPVRTGAGQ